MKAKIVDALFYGLFMGGLFGLSFGFVVGFILAITMELNAEFYIFHVWLPLIVVCAIIGGIGFVRIEWNKRKPQSQKTQHGEEG